MIIAVDGPAASGKGTIAKALARHYGLPHLDTGLLYRAVALTVQRMELDPAIEADAVAAVGPQGHEAMFCRQSVSVRGDGGTPRATAIR